jgi:hypothetical protein
LKPGNSPKKILAIAAIRVDHAMRSPIYCDRGGTSRASAERSAIKGREMNNTNHVKIHAHAIVAKIQPGKLMLGVADFSRTPIIAARARTSVEFKTGITREDAMAALTALLEVIKADGLPETSWSIDRKHVRKFDQMLRRFATAKQCYHSLSTKSQQRWRELHALETQPKDRVSYHFSEEHFRVFKWSIQADVGSDTSGPTKR